MSEQLVAELKKCIAPFKFGKMDLMERMNSLEVSRDENSGVVRIKNWYDYSEQNVYGDCGELMTKGGHKIMQVLPDLELHACWGYDGEFFTELTGKHSFLIVQEKGNSTKIVVDPSLQKVEYLEGSKYMVIDTEPSLFFHQKLAPLDDQIADAVSTLTLDGNRGSFLGKNSLNDLLYYLDLNSSSQISDILMLTLYILPEKGSPYEGMPPLRDPKFISPCPEEIRKQEPLFELAYQLEQYVQTHLKTA